MWVLGCVRENMRECTRDIALTHNNNDPYLPNGGGNGGGKSVTTDISSPSPASERSLLLLFPPSLFLLLPPSLFPPLFNFCLLELLFNFFCSFLNSIIACRLRSLDLSSNFLVSTRYAVWSLFHQSMEYHKDTRIQRKVSG